MWVHSDVWKLSCCIYSVVVNQSDCLVKMWLCWTCSPYSIKTHWKVKSLKTEQASDASKLMVDEFWNDIILGCIWVPVAGGRSSIIGHIPWQWRQVMLELIDWRWILSPSSSSFLLFPHHPDSLLISQHMGGLAMRITSISHGIDMEMGRL